MLAMFTVAGGGLHAVRTLQNDGKVNPLILREVNDVARPPYS